MQSPFKMNCLAAGVLICLATAARAQPRPAVIELFTSEGCSSCPPADSYLGELSQHRDVLALAFHVDYWDDLGWKDPFALREAVPRQRGYAQMLHRSSVYTPQIVIDGRDDYMGSDRSGIRKSISVPRNGIPVGVSIHGGEIQVELGHEDRAATSDVLLIAYLRRSVSAIGRGENAGRTLQEFNIVRAIHNLGRWSGQIETLRSEIATLPQDATDVAVLVQSLGQAPVIGAAACALR